MDSWMGAFAVSDTTSGWMTFAALRHGHFRPNMALPPPTLNFASSLLPTPPSKIPPPPTPKWPNGRSPPPQPRPKKKGGHFPEFWILFSPVGVFPALPSGKRTFLLFSEMIPGISIACLCPESLWAVAGQSCSGLESLCHQLCAHAAHLFPSNFLLRTLDASHHTSSNPSPS